MKRSGLAFSVDISVREKGRKRPDYKIDSDLGGEMTLKDLLEWTKASLIVIADQVLKEEQARGFDKKPILIVDNRKNKPIQAVHPLGKIQFISRQSISKIVLETYEALLFRSKVLTGRYKRSHFVFLNGIQVASDLPSLKAWLATNPTIRDSDSIRIVNIQPYARKLERYGITAQRSKTRYQDQKKRGKKTGRIFLVPNGTYHLVTRAIRAKYKRNSNIRFTFLPGSSLGLTASFKSGRRGKNSAGRPYLYPSIIIKTQGRGLTDV